RRHAGKLQTVIEDLNLPNPVIRSHYRKGFLKQYVRDRFLLRTESATNNISTDYGIGKAVENLPELRMRLHGIIDRYLEVQQDILETFLDREELRRLTQPTLLPNGRRIPGLKLYEKIYAPLTAGILQPFAAVQSSPKEKITALDRRYNAVIEALDDLVEAVGLKAA